MNTTRRFRAARSSVTHALCTADGWVEQSHLFRLAASALGPEHEHLRAEVVDDVLLTEEGYWGPNVMADIFYEWNEDKGTAVARFRYQLNCCS